MTPNLTATVTWNPAYTKDFGDGEFCVTRIPGGYWAVKIRPRADHWIIYAVPLTPLAGAPIALAVGPDKTTVASAAWKWRTQASTVALRYFPYAATGDAARETPQPGGAVDAAFAEWKACPRCPIP